MSLAMFAAPFNDKFNNDLISDDSESLINKKKQIHNKTQKKLTKENFDTEKVNSVLEKIHNSKDDDDDREQLDDFNPPPKPQSAGVNKTVATEQMMNMTNQNDIMFKTLGRAPQPTNEEYNKLDLNDYSNYGDNNSNNEYYKKVLPGYVPVRSQTNKPYYNTNYNMSNQQPDDVLLQKLNYMISLLEDQQDEKTNNVTEEVVLYSFLGIFIIFVVDSFARVGKYAR